MDETQKYNQHPKSNNNGSLYYGPTHQPTNTKNFTNEEILKLIHELEVHQIELQLQNEELIRVHEEAKIIAEKYTELYDFAPSGYFTLSSQCEIIQLNLTGAKMLGRDLAQLKNRLFPLYVSDVSKSIFRLFLEKVFNTKTSESCEIKMLTQNNLPFYLYLSGIAHANGEQCFITAIDITKQKEIESEVKEQQNLSWKYLEIAGVMMCALNTNGEITLINRKGLDILGYKDEGELLGKNWFELTLPLGNVTYAKEVFAQLISGEIKPYQKYENPVLSKNGKELLLAFNSTILQDNENHISGILFSGEDITERKLAEKRLNESEERLRLIIETEPECVKIIDTKGKLLEMNSAGLRMLEVESLAELQQYSLLDFILPEYHDSFLEVHHKVMNNEKANWEFEVKGLKGTLKWLDTKAVPLHDADNKVVGLLGVTRDITVRKKAEQEIKLKNEELHQVIANDVHEMSHDQIQIMANSMHKSAIQLNQLLENLLNWSRMQQGLKSFDPQLLSLAGFINDNLPITIETARNKGINISFNIPEELQVYADAHMLDSILRNLTMNAIKYSHNGDTIKLSARLNGTTVDISVSDTGIGMSSEMIENLFQFDVNTCRPGTNNEPSTGLGVLLCKEFVEKHGGKLKVESDPDGYRGGKGSTFCFSLPVGGNEKKKNEKS